LAARKQHPPKFRKGKISVDLRELIEITADKSTIWVIFKSGDRSHYSFNPIADKEGKFEVDEFYEALVEAWLQV
jgi:hypothetical protein